MVIEKGTMLKLNYIGKRKSDSYVFDTTLEDVAKKEGIYDEKVIYKPCLVVIGKHWLPIGLEEQLIGLKEGDKKTIEVEAKQAFGLHDRSKIRLIQRREFQKLDIKPKAGMEVEITGQKGRIMKVDSSRVKVDFNHPLAGEDVIYEVEIVKIITDVKEQFVALLERRLPGIDFSGTKIEIEGKILVVELPPHSRFLEYIQFTKNAVTRDISEFVKNKMDKVKFIEFYEIDK
ncbi:MAG: peptidylprolyl isomerase [Candidatus Heimdallarchaeum endolithica]|uniref:Peptidyl-prolyl cis-trans isomerase n=1 Tax=Candidatus Heimdallarchaeum endolithica TaxID=2876572 RepID=A0A9Y1FN63_9ARCH|nr:MAG: peptidylprolyl isomerase [Candidatus Heimdallarchaeum endolithica]